MQTEHSNRIGDATRIPIAGSLVELKGMPDRSTPREERGDAHPLPVGRRRFLQRSAMAVAGGVLFSCTGGRTIRSVDAQPDRGHRHAMADQAGHLPDAREPELRQPVRAVPRRERHDAGVAHGKEQPLIRCPDWLPGDLPHDRAAALNCLNGGKLDGFGGGSRAPCTATHSSTSRRSRTTTPGRASTRSPTTSSRRRSAPRTRTTSTSSPASRAA